MDVGLVDFWQREAARFETMVHAQVTRTYALLGVVFTVLASVVVAISATKLAQIALVIPVMAIFFGIMAFATLEEVLEKALLQYRSERMLTALLERNGGYLTWDDFGGRIGQRTGTTYVRVVAVVAAALLLSASALVYFELNFSFSRLWREVAATQWLCVVLVISCLVLGALLLAFLITSILMMRTYASARKQLGFNPKLTVEQAIAGASAPSPARRRRG